MHNGAPGSRLPSAYANLGSRNLPHLPRAQLLTPTQPAGEYPQSTRSIASSPIEGNPMGQPCSTLYGKRSAITLQRRRL